MNPALQLRDSLRERRVPLGSIDLRPLWRGRALERHRNAPTTLRRAHAFAAVLAQMALPIRPEEVLVGAPSGVLADALPAGVDRCEYDRCASLNAALGERTFLTNRDHIAPDYPKLLQVGLTGLLDETQRSAARHVGQQRVFLQSVEIALRAGIYHLKRWADACRGKALTAEPARAAELRRMARDLDVIACGPPHSFAQALQLVWLVHVMLNVDGRGAMAFGRMDQYLYPYYRRSVQAGEGERARGLLECMWAKLEEPLLLNPVQNICIGGQTREGDDAVNELSYLLLEVTGTVRTPNSNLSARLCASTPDPFRVACVELIKTGIGFPALFNDEVLVPALVRLGIPLREARDYAFVGCIETFLPGRMPPWSDSRVNLLAALDRALRSGRDGLTGELCGALTPPPEELTTYGELFEAFATQVAHMVDEHCDQISQEKRVLSPTEYTSPFLSAFVADCIDRGRDVNDGGARFPDWHGPAGMALGSTADALAAIKCFIYDRGSLSWTELLCALDADFCGCESLRQRLLHAAPKYGNGDMYVDNVAADVVRVFTGEVLRHRTPSGGRFVPLMAANISNIAAGREVGATPDGRHAGEPVSDAASPTFGRDRRGPTAAIESLCRVDYGPVVGGTVVNMRFSPQTLRGERGTRALCALIEGYFAQGGMQLQLNVTGRETLEAALREPEAYRHLVVRVSGFSALYLSLSREVQDDILARTEH
jgi:formate C-acetyltransferase